jgi:hypothetical protein
MKLFLIRGLKAFNHYINSLFLQEFNFCNYSGSWEPDKDFWILPLISQIKFLVSFARSNYPRFLSVRKVFAKIITISAW